MFLPLDIDWIVCASGSQSKPVILGARNEMSMYISVMTALDKIVAVDHDFL